MPDELGAEPAGGRDEVRGGVVHGGVQQHRRRDPGAVEALEQSERADPVAVVPPRRVHEVRGGDVRHDVLGPADAKPVLLEPDRDVDRQAAPVRPRGSSRDRDRLVRPQSVAGAAVVGSVSSFVIRSTCSCRRRSGRRVARRR